MRSPAAMADCWESCAPKRGKWRTAGEPCAAKGGKWRTARKSCVAGRRKRRASRPSARVGGATVVRSRARTQGHHAVGLVETANSIRAVSDTLLRVTARQLDCRRWLFVAHALWPKRRKSRDSRPAEPANMARSSVLRFIRNRCIAQCADTSLPSGDYGFNFWNCVNKCMQKYGCPTVWG